jgi:uncharacterized protein
VSVAVPVRLDLPLRRIADPSVFPSDRPIESIVVKLASRCNMACTYCYWFRDDAVYETPPRLTEEAEAAFVRRLDEHVRRHRIERFVIGLHGGEPLLFGKRRTHQLLTELRRVEAATGTELEIHVTTNGVLVDDDWAALFRFHEVSVGVSIDGPPAVHDLRRIDLAGGGTHERVVAGIGRLRAWGIEPGILAVCDPSTDPAALVRYLVDELDVESFDVLVPDARHGDHPPSIAAYYTALTDLWLDGDNSHPVRIRWLEAATRSLLGHPSGVDSIGYGPITIVTLVTDGSIEVQDVCRIAGSGSTKSPLNVFTHDFDDVRRDPQWRAINAASLQLAEECQSCEWQYACGGGHIASRWSAERGYDNPSVYCTDFKQIFEHLRRRVEPTLSVEAVSARVPSS